MPKSDCVNHNKLENPLRDGNTRSSYLPPEKSMQVKKQQLETDMEQQTGCKLGKEYIKAVYCHPAYLTYMEKAMALHSSTLLPGKSHGRGSVAGFSPWGC